ncbi:MAG TPA: molybdopterin synthase sulfur carrier subunit [Cyanobacteria bacterium UBA8530]|nr:molybdopterin synthase sulfur carrier subunit [Cyanobacteria bacterium UBA8530]
MLLNIKLFASFQTGRFAVEQRECLVETSIADIADELRIPRGEIGIILVGGRHVELDYRPTSGETVALFPLLGGG